MIAFEIILKITLSNVAKDVHFKERENGAKIVFQQMVLAQLNIHMQKPNLNTGLTPFTKISKIDHRPKYNMQNYKTPKT